MPRVRYQHAKRAELHRLAIEGDGTAEAELTRRQRIAELKREALAEARTCPEIKIKKGLPAW